MYVMTSEFGAPTQLEKIDMIDFADLIAINKFERKGSEDALRQVQKQYQRSHGFWDKIWMTCRFTAQSQANSTTKEQTPYLRPLSRKSMKNSATIGKHLMKSCQNVKSRMSSFRMTADYYLREIVRNGAQLP